MLRDVRFVFFNVFDLRTRLSTIHFPMSKSIWMIQCLDAIRAPSDSIEIIRDRCMIPMKNRSDRFGFRVLTQCRLLE